MGGAPAATVRTPPAQISSAVRCATSALHRAYGVREAGRRDGRGRGWSTDSVRCCRVQMRCGSACAIATACVLLVRRRLLEQGVCMRARHAPIPAQATAACVRGACCRQLVQGHGALCRAGLRHHRRGHRPDAHKHSGWRRGHRVYLNFQAAPMPWWDRRSAACLCSFFCACCITAPPNCTCVHPALDAGAETHAKTLVTPLHPVFHSLGLYPAAMVASKAVRDAADTEMKAGCAKTPDATKCEAEVTKQLKDVDKTIQDALPSNKDLYNGCW